MSKLMIDPKKMAVAEKTVPQGKPVTMLNLVAYNDQAKYEDAEQTPCSGAEAYYNRYVPAFYEVAKELGIADIEVVYKGKIAQTILAPDDSVWDDISLVRYKDFATMRRLLEAPEYLKRAEPHRVAALKDWEWVATFDPES